MNRYHQHSDADLVTLLVAGNRDAFEAIYERHAADLFRYASRTVADREECREIIQEVFESLWTRRSSLTVDNLNAYLYSAVRYRIIHYFRRQNLLLKYARHYEAFESIHATLPEEDRTPDTIRTLLTQSLDGLTDRCRTAFSLRLHENLSNAEIAERMNISKGTVELYMVRAFQHLRNHAGLKKALDSSS